MSTDSVAYILSCPRGGVLDKIYFRTGTVYVGATISVSVEGVDDTSGAPDGTPLSAGATAQVVIDSANDDTGFIANLTEGVAVSTGQYISVRLQNPVSDSGQMRFSCVDATNFGQVSGYTTKMSSSVWSKNSFGGVLGLGFTDDTWSTPVNWNVYNSVSVLSVASNSAYNHIGNKITMRFPATTIGCWLWADIDANVNVYLYDSDSVVIATATFDNNMVSANSNAPQFSYFNTQVSLATGGVYRLVAVPQTTTAIAFNTFDTYNSALMDAMEWGTDVIASTRTDAGAWSDMNTKRVMISLIFNGIDDGAGTGGGGGTTINIPTNGISFE